MNKPKSTGTINLGSSPKKHAKGAITIKQMIAEGKFPADILDKTSAPSSLPNLMTPSNGQQETTDTPPQTEASPSAHSDEQAPSFLNTGDNLVIIPLSSLRPSPYNSRRFRTTERIDAIAASLTKHGQNEPLSVYPGTDGLYYILSGVTRFTAASIANLTSLKCIVRYDIAPDDIQKIYATSHIHNDKNDETDLDHAYAARDLKNNGHTYADIAQTMDLSKTQVSRLLSFFELPKAVLDAAAKKPARFTANFANHVATAFKDFGEDFALDLTYQILEKDLTVRKLQAILEKEKDRLQNPSANSRHRKQRLMINNLNYGDNFQGVLTIYRAPGTGMKALTLQAEVPDDIADKIASEITSLLEQYKN